MNIGVNFCPKCGSKLDIDAKFCNTCGVGLTDRTEEMIPSIQEGIPKQEVQSMKPIETPGIIYAEIPERLIAWLIDILIILAISRGFSWFVPWINPFAFFDIISSALTFFIDFLIGFLYFWLLEVYNKGQTFGKMVLNIRTVDEKSSQLATPANYAINNLSKSTAFLLLDVIIGVLINSGEHKGRLRLTQNMSKTVVIKDRKK